MPGTPAAAIGTFLWGVDVITCWTPAPWDGHKGPGNTSHQQLQSAVFHFTGSVRLGGKANFAALALAVTVALGGCQAGLGNAFIGPNPGGGFPCPHNAFEDCALPSG